MITHSLTMFFFYIYFLLLVKNKSRSKFRSREKVDLNFLFILCKYIIFSMIKPLCLCIKTFNFVRVS